MIMHVLSFLLPYGLANMEGGTAAGGLANLDDLLVSLTENVEGTIIHRAPATHDGTVAGIALLPAALFPRLEGQAQADRSLLDRPPIKTEAPEQ